MRLTSPSRRAAGLLAATTIGLSTAVLSVTGVASAADSAPSFTFTTAGGAVTSGVVPNGICGIDWRVIGGQGGAGSDLIEGGQPGDQADELHVVTAVTAGQSFDLYPGGAGGNATPTTGGAAGAGPQDGAADGTAGSEYDPDADTDTANSTYGGGGGAGSLAKLHGGTGWLGAAGGDGGGATAGFGSGDTGVDGLNTLGDTWFAGPTDETGGSDKTGAGLITGTGVACAVPEAPDVQQNETEAGDGQVTVRFFAPYTADDQGNPRRNEDGFAYQAPDGYEYSLNDGDSWDTLTTAPGTGNDEALYGTVSDLENGAEVSIVIRATSAAGPGKTSEAVTATPVHVLSAPTDLHATVGTSSITITWAPPVGPDAAEVEGYTAWAIPTGAQSSAGMVFCPDMDAAARSCLVGVPAGQAYSVGVSADNGYQGEAAFADTGVVPAQATPATVPASSGTMTSSDTDGALTAGEQITLSGTGYLPNSTVDLYVYSTPTKVGTAVADEAGNFTATVTLPASLANGTHHLVAAGVDPSGNPRYLVVEVTVSGGTAVVTAAGGLAYTGFSALPFVGGGLLTLVAGAGLLVASRRRAS